MVISKKLSKDQKHYSKIDFAQGAESNLVICTNSQNELTKNQIKFNKLIKEIEKVKAKITKRNSKLDNLFNEYFECVSPEERQLSDIHEQLVINLSKFWNHERLTKGERELLKEAIAEQISFYTSLNHGEISISFEPIIEKIEGKSMKELRDIDFKQMVEEFVFDIEETYGVELTKDQIETLHKCKTLEELTSAFANINAKTKVNDSDYSESDIFTAKNSKKHKEQNQKKTLFSYGSSIGDLYRKLARKFHPDLELDVEKKLKKEELMKKLTLAYEKKDLIGLLELDLLFNNDTSSSVLSDTTNDEVIATYNKALSTQLNELRRDCELLLWNNRYSPLHRYTSSPGFIDRIKIPSILNEIREQIKKYRKDLELISENSDSLKNLKKFLRKYKEIQQREMELDDFFDFLNF